MRALSSIELLELWERGFRLHTLDRGLLALGAAHPAAPYESLADWTLGARNSTLAELRCACFGPNLQGQISCPQCAENLEFEMDGKTLIKRAPDSAEAVFAKGHSFRVPTTRDLARAAEESDARLAAIRLVEACRTDASESPVWRDEDLQDLGDQMAAADPMAEIRLAFNCAKCSHHWEENLDIAAFFWMEVETQAKRLLTEIHTLAAAYGWTEQEVLSLSEPRRRFYLEMVSE